MRVRGSVGRRLVDPGIMDHPDGDRVKNGLSGIGAFIAEKGILGINRASPCRNRRLFLVGQQKRLCTGEIRLLALRGRGERNTSRGQGIARRRCGTALERQEWHTGMSLVQVEPARPEQGQPNQNDTHAR